jgi:drug/metabolite transporter (DMT)-like permease
MRLAGARRGHLVGAALALAGATCWSFGGVLIRLTHGIDTWQIIFYRSTIVLLVIGAWVWHANRGRLLWAIHDAGINGLVAGVAVGLASLTFVAALFYTTVAQTIFMVGVSPFCAALLGWWVLRERVSGVTWGAMVVALAGLFVMVGGAIDPSERIGTILALYSAFCFSCYSVLLRWGQNTDMTVAMVWASLFLIVFSAAVMLLPIPLRDTHGLDAFAIGWHNLALTVVMGAGQLSLGMILFIRGSRSVPAAELALLALIEPIISPVWAYLAVGEVPALATLAGGAVIMTAIVMQVMLGGRREPVARTRRLAAEEGRRR